MAVMTSVANDLYGDYKTQNRKSNSKQKTSPQSYKTQISILPFPGLAQTGTEQPRQGATLLGWPKIYILDFVRFVIALHYANELLVCVRLFRNNTKKMFGK